MLIITIGRTMIIASVYEKVLLPVVIVTISCTMITVVESVHFCSQVPPDLRSSHLALPGPPDHLGQEDFLLTSLS